MATLTLQVLNGLRSGTSSSLRRMLAIVLTLPLSGCGLVHTPALDPKGPIALAERDLLFAATGLMLIVIIPVFLLAFWFAWRYRASNPKAPYMPEWSYSARPDALVWLVPILIVATLGYLVWAYTHRLDPYSPVAPDVAPSRSRWSPRTGNGCSSTPSRLSRRSTSWSFLADGRSGCKRR